MTPPSSDPHIGDKKNQKLKWISKIIQNIVSGELGLLLIINLLSGPINFGSGAFGGDDNDNDEDDDGDTYSRYRPFHKTLPKPSVNML